MCMCLALDGVGGEGGECMRGLDLGFTNPVGSGKILNVYLCFGCAGVYVVGGEWVGTWTRVWRGGVVLYMCELLVWIICVDGRSRYQCIVHGGYLRI